MTIVIRTCPESTAVLSRIVRNAFLIKSLGFVIVAKAPLMAPAVQRSQNRQMALIARHANPSTGRE